MIKSLENKYPDIVVTVNTVNNKILDVSMSCCLEGIVIDSHKDMHNEGITILDEVEITNFFVSDTCAFDCTKLKEIE